MSKPDVNLLMDLDALLREGSVVGAARRLHLSAPAMSRRLTRLREAIGDPLFVRAGRGLVPTPRALALRERVQTVIDDIHRVFTPDEVDFSRLRRTLTLRANDGFAGAWATRLAATIAVQAPSVSLHFAPRADKHIGALRSGSVDLDIGAVDIPDPEIHSQALFRASFVGVVRENHPLLLHMAGAEVSAQEFAACSHISASRRGSATGPIDEELKKIGLHRRIAIVAPGFQAALVMAASSELVAAMPEPFARWALGHQRLQLFKLPIATPVVEISQSWHSRHHADPVHRWLREQVRLLCRTEAG